MPRRAAPPPPPSPSIVQAVLGALGPLQPNSRSIAAVLLCALGWEAIYRLAQLICHVTAHSVVQANHKKGPTAFRNNGSTYVCAFVHAVITGGRGLWHIWELLDAPLVDKLRVNPDPASAYHQTGIETELTNLLFFSWLLYDTVHVLSWYPVLGGLDTLAHHLCFMLGSFITGSYRALPFQFSWLITGECSSPFLNLRWFLINTGNGGSALMQVVNLAFGLTFFVVRVLLYTLGLAHMAAVTPTIVSLGILPLPILGVIGLILAAGYSLNLMWAAKIWHMAFGANQSGNAEKHA